MSAEQTRKLIVLAAIWAALLLAPYWMVPLGGYTALATRVLVLGLAAMSLNFLLGFTGVLSFGHAAYFGLGAYGAGLTLKFLAPSTPLALLARNAAGRHLRRHPRHADRAAARRLFRHGDDRLRPGVLLHRLPVEFADRRRRRLARLLAPADRSSASSSSTSSPTPRISTSSCCSALRWRSAPWDSFCARRSAAP